VAAAQVADSKLAQALQVAGDFRLLIQDEAGVFHFNGRFRNAGNVATVLEELAQEEAYADLVAAERPFILTLFEETFNHRAFTGRSGTFFAYEGLGSIYWHMISKLLLAAQEAYQQGIKTGVDTAVSDALAEAYYDIRDGIGFNKTPEVYGAFPTDPYSHTPMGSGARQPGMTGQVKEEILTRWGELGISVREGALCFKPTLLRSDEFLAEPSQFSVVNLAGETETVDLQANSLAFTFCQIPVIYQRGEQAQIEVVGRNGRSAHIAGSCLDPETTHHILNRDGQVYKVIVTVRI
jgi:hypothetical protein